MVKTHTRILQGGKTYVYIPSFLRKDFNLDSDSEVDVTKENGKIIITVLGD
ncbi:MAG: hypothetical protein PHN69_06245 [Candidatus Pacebacteria bacterium]|nr:hypothetical protein [Candidatus Paceibacterota bacterium]